ncbi:MAG: hypothetical protein KAW12_30475 [Candidatus Aminicenantes bacterium]|nr:hypothetical protein [Candidatus Aminicenantes bacterium]
MIEIKKIQDIEDYKQLAQVQKSAWGFDDIEIEPPHIMTRIQKYGGLIQGLFHGSEMVAFTEAIIGKWQGEYFIYSHMAAVKKEYQGRGFGFLLKKAQGEEVLKMGYRLMRWSFDPLESQNSFFNIHRLGVVSREYERNAYGMVESGLHEGLPTDRLIASWELDSGRVKKRLEEKLPKQIEAVPPASLDSFVGPVAYIEIPRDIRSLKKVDMKKAREWRMRTRELFEFAFKKGYNAEEIVFSEDKKRIFYKLVCY